MGRRIGSLWQDRAKRILPISCAFDVVGATGPSRTWRMILQSLMLDLRLRSKASIAGIMIATSIMLARALSPNDRHCQLAHMVSTRQSWRPAADAAQRRCIKKPLTLRGLGRRCRSRLFSSQLPASKNQSSRMWRSLASGAGWRHRRSVGKSTLAQARRALDALRGTVRLDAAALDQFDEEVLDAISDTCRRTSSCLRVQLPEHQPFQRQCERMPAVAPSCRGQTDDPSADDGFQTRIGEGGPAFRRPASDGRPGEGIVWRSILVVLTN